MKNLLFIAVFVLTHFPLFGQGNLAPAPAPMSPDASQKEERREDEEQFFVPLAWLENKVAFHGKQYFTVGQFFYRLDTVKDAKGEYRLAKKHIARFDGLITRPVVLGKYLYFIEENGGYGLFRYTGNEIQYKTNVGDNNCTLHGLKQEAEKLIISIECKNKIEVLEYSKEFLERK